ncbi:MAG: glycosyltransferase, partial [Patescibacteria group bacterium]
MSKLSVVLATRNEEKNIGPCLKWAKGIGDEIIVVDEYSTDKTREIAK